MKLAGKPVAGITLVTVLVAAVITWVLWPSAQETHPREQSVTVLDGPRDDQQVTLDATFFPPAGGGRAPAVLLAHGFGGSKESVREAAVRLAGEGYAVLTWSARGFGRSTGQIALNSPDYEVKDVRQLLDWLARRPEVSLDAAGDPKVGVAGGSYGGAIALMAAAYDNRIDAIVPQITWHDLADALFPEAGGRGPLNGVFKRMWAGLFFSRGGTSPAPGPLRGATPTGEAPPASAQEVRCGRFLPELCDVYQRIAETGRATPEAIETLRRSSPVSVPGRIKVPTLLLQGTRDSLFPLGQADANARAVAATGAPVAVAWFDGGHDGGDGEADWIHERTTAWFARYLKGDAGQATVPFTVTRDGGRDPGTRRPVQLHATAPAYPGLYGATTTQVALTGPAQPVANPPGGSPSSISSVPGFGGLGGSPGVSLSTEMAGQSAHFDSAPLTAPLQVTGSSTVRVRVRAEGTGGTGGKVSEEGVTLFAKLYDAGPGGQAPILPDGLVAPVRVALSPDGTGEATVALPAVDHRFDAGHRLRVAFTTTDLGYSTPAAPAVYQVELAAPTLTVPVDAALRTPQNGPSWWTWALPAAAVVAAAVLLLTGRRRRRTDHDPALADVPLRIDGLTKAYRNGERAVDDLSFTVERGQVLGLLGPNGAGKTTTMRMMMGLIHPDAGEIRIFGHRISPGAAVLSRLGSFVEGPGFLPHLTGRANLELYWKATGRPEHDAHFAEALEIAGLGAALDRAVRTYSQGMRQRLAIAQAMLGLPDLLVLDEPANGLDPPQIREMREVLIAYAARGRTVIVSSHLLAEVEQTCSHVVVMRRGRLVTAGPVRDLLGEHTSGGSGGGSGSRLEDVFLDLIGEKA
ncbi:alpha/beta fold hydrolase [Streptosporangium sp. NPDC049376]|uniref:alpha/beta fold hydrolase n=1 Tax=Streptosporangium sp. NPDC049376 TaxID=3366192 RepID=UPI0037956947